MRFLKLKSFVFVLVTIFTISLVITACEQQEMAEVQTVSSEEQEILDFLESQDIHEHDIHFLEDYVLYQEDAGWDKEYLLQAARGEILEEVTDPDPEAEALQSRQRGIPIIVRNDAVRQNRVNSITFFIHSSVQNDCGIAWVNATRDAVVKWNNVSNSRVQLTEVFSSGPADIIIGSDDSSIMPASHRNIGGLARGDFSQNGRVGEWIAINDAFDGWMHKEKTMMHEFGHNLGYRHTGSTDGEHIHTTATTPTESVMYQSSTSVVNVFTSEDRKAIRMYYPQDLDQPQLISATRVGAGAVRINYRNNSNTNKPYFWVRVYRYNNWGILLGTFNVRARTSATGFHSFVLNGLGTANSRFALRGFNLRRDVNSPITPRSALVNL